MTDRNLNYSGDDAPTVASQAASDRWFGEIARARSAQAHPLPPEDRLDLIELTGLWDAAYDALDRETWLACLTDDFVFASQGFGEFSGRPAMEGFFDTYSKVFHGLRHVVSNHIVVGDRPDVARGWCYLTVFERINSTDMLGTTVFMDRYVRRGGRWLFARRDQVLDPGMTQTVPGQRLMAAYGEVLGKQKAQ